MNPASNLIRRLRKRIDFVLGDLLSGIRDVALLDFPIYANVGDSAIWLGERRWLRESGIRVRYAADIHTFRADLLRARLPDGAILLQGGGNFGDLWAGPQQFREEVIATFTDRRIIVLPQTMWYRRRSEMERARRIYDAHPDLTLLLRDQPSLDMARSHFQCRSELCPDMAFALGAVDRTIGPEAAFLRLLRSDLEMAANRSDLDLPQGPGVDWSDAPSDASYRLLRLLRGALADRPSAYAVTWRSLSLLGELHARMRVRHGFRLLSRGETIVTDRLHGHILCILLGQPHLLVENSYGKVGAFHDSWTRGCPLVLGFEPGETVGDVTTMRCS